MKVTTVKPSGTASLASGLFEGLIFAWTPYGTYRRSAVIDLGSGEIMEPSAEIVGAFHEWLDNELSNSLKLGIFCRGSSPTRLRFIPNPDRTESRISLQMSLFADKIELQISTNKNEWCSDKINVPSYEPAERTYAEYADPEMFDIVRAALARVYNGS